VPDSPCRDARPLRLALIALALASVALAGCGTSVPDISVPSIPDMSAPGGGSATFSINGVTFTVAQSGTINADFPESRQITYSGPLGCRGHYFSGEYTNNIDVYFHYFKKDAYLLIDNGPEPIYHFGPPLRRGNLLLFANADRRDREITVAVSCPTGA
jgi:hypothetical protein